MSHDSDSVIKIDYEWAARTINLQRKVLYDDEELNKFIKMADFWKVLGDLHGIPIKQEWFDSIAENFEGALELNRLFQTWDIQIFNEWKVTSRLLKKFYEDSDSSSELHRCITKYRV